MFRKGPTELTTKTHFASSSLYQSFLLVPQLFFCVILTLSCTPSNDPSSANQAEKKTLNLFIWSNYVSSESLMDFEKESNLKVKVTNFGSNEELLAKLQAGATGYDVVVPSDYMVAVMVKLGLLEPLKRNLIPHWEGLDSQFLGKEFDEKNEYSVPYGWASTGIAYNKKYFPQGLKTWKEFFENPRLKGHVGMLDDTREVFGAALKAKGHSLNSTNEGELKEAQEYLIKNKGQVKAYLVDALQAISTGEVWATQMYSSDAMQAEAKTKGEIQYVIPEEGATFAIDNLAIPKTSRNIEGAHRLINFLISIENNKRFVQKIYAGPVLKATKDKLPESFRKNQNLFPDKSILGRLEMIKDLGEVTNLYDRLWTELKTQ